MAVQGATLSIPVPDVNDQMTVFTVIQVEAASSFGGSYSLIQTITLVADDTEYEYTYTSATASGYWRYRFYNPTGPVASNYSEPMPFSVAPTTSRQELRQRAAHRLGLYMLPPTEYSFPGPSGTTTSAGTSSTIVCASFASSAYMDTGSTTYSKVFDGDYLYISSGGQSGTERRIRNAAAAGTPGLDYTTGTFTVSPAWAGAPGSGVTFEGYMTISASQWNHHLEAARLDLWYPAEVVITGVSSQTEYPLPYWIERDDQVLALSQRIGDTYAEHRYSRGYGFDLLPQEGGGVILYLPNGIAANSVWTLECQRHPAPFTSDTAAIPLSEQYQRVWWLTAAMRAAQAKAQEPVELTDNTAMWQRRFDELNKELASVVQEIGWRKQAPARRRQMVAVGGGRWGQRGGARSAYY